MGLCDRVRESAAAIAAEARHVSIDLDRLDAIEPGPPPSLDPERHFLEGSRGDVAAYLLTLDAINFGSGWFPTLRKRPGSAGYYTIASALADRFRSHGPWSNEELRRIDADTLADVLGQERGHELMRLYAEALRQLGEWLGADPPLARVEAAAAESAAPAVPRVTRVETAARGSAAPAAPPLARVDAAAGESAPATAPDGGLSAEALAEALRAMPFFDDVGFWKRAQITANDFQLAGIVGFGDIDRLTIFADNLVPHVLRVDGVLRYDEALAARIDAGELLPPGAEEREIRGCAVHACELIAAELRIPPRDLDVMLWNRGQGERYKSRPRHRTRTVYY